MEKLTDGGKLRVDYCLRYFAVSIQRVSEARIVERNNTFLNYLLEREKYERKHGMRISSRTVWRKFLFKSEIKHRFVHFLTILSHQIAVRGTKPNKNVQTVFPTQKCLSRRVDGNQILDSFWSRAYEVILFSYIKFPTLSRLVLSESIFWCRHALYSNDALSLK